MINIRKIIGKTVIIRKANRRDLGTLFTYIWNDLEILSTTFLPPTDNLEDAENRLERTINFQKDKPMYVLALKKTNEAIGFCGIMPLEDGNYQERGLFIGKPFQNKGYGSETINIFLDIVFNNLNADEFVYSYCDGNEKSKKIADKFGFKYKDYSLEKREWDGREFKVNHAILRKEDYQGIDFKYQIL